MVRIALHSKKLEVDKIPFLLDILAQIEAFDNVRLLLSQELGLFLRKHCGPSYAQYPTFSGPDELQDVRFMVSVGGDGTLLNSLTYVRDRQIPILGVNAGRLGFLAPILPDKLRPALEAVLNGYYRIEERSMLKLESDADLFKGMDFALNEFTILKRDSSSMIVVKTYLDGEYLNTYWSDGLIVATPTGSTGYSLSVGGPVVMPDSQSFIISPVCPHNLNVRPLIVSDRSVISFEVESRSRHFLVSLDSRSRPVDASIQLAVRKCPFPARLIRLAADNYLTTLRTKLNWGFDTRN